MLKTLVLTIALVPTLIGATPIFQRTENSTIPYNPDLPTVLILGTGGTISGAAPNSDVIGYEAGSLNVEDLVATAPGIVNVSNIVGEQVENVGSHNLNSSTLLKLSKRSNEALCSEDAEFDGVVITHGTDTTEETAFFMDLTVNCGKPVVVVAAMRPSSALSADGPANLLEAVAVAASPDSKHRGSMIVLNDRICSSYYCRKAHANFLDTFIAQQEGNIGGFLNYKPFFYFTPATPTFKHNFDISGVEELPTVDILHSYQEFRSDLIDSAVATGSKGIVIAGTGTGNYPELVSPSIEAAYEQGIPIVASTKTGQGISFRKPDEVTIAGGALFASHARIQLQLALGVGMSMDEIRSLFEDQLLHYIDEF